jgi:D-sedoheptulose 7-phosphate isomerase
MSDVSFFSKYFDVIHQKSSSAPLELLENAAHLAMDTHLRERKLIFVGNGGSAAMASHLCVDFTKAAGIRAVNFNEADLITCFANDYGYEHWVSKALEAYADPGDLAVLISSSGKSPNILNAAQTARQLKLTVITVSGFAADNPLCSLGDVNLWVDSTAYNVVEMTHHIWLLAIADYIIEMKKSACD